MTQPEPTVVVVTPFHNSFPAFHETIKSVLSEIGETDLWVVSADHSTAEQIDQLQTALAGHRNVVCLISDYPNGAGHARNFALDWCHQQNWSGPKILTFIDADDAWIPGFVAEMKSRLPVTQGCIVAYSYTKVWPDGTTKDVINPKGIMNFSQFLHHYTTPCLSTVLYLTEMSQIAQVRFGKRKRANDQLFFMGAVQTFGQVENCPDIWGIYNVGNLQSLSGNKFKTPYYKLLALLDMKLPLHKVVTSMITYVWTRLARS